MLISCVTIFHYVQRRKMPRTFANGLSIGDVAGIPAAVISIGTKIRLS